jgi:hypothetical protein
MISKGSNLPDEHHVMRYVPWSKLRKDENENVIGFLPQAFELRDGELSLSLNWLEYFSGDRNQRIRESVNMFRATRDKVGAKSAYGIGNVRRVKEVCDSNGARVRIVYEPDAANPAHAGIRRLPRDDLSLLAALATQAFVELVRNTQI